jgi:hypothetical protein
MLASITVGRARATSIAILGDLPEFWREDSGSAPGEFRQSAKTKDHSPEISTFSSLGAVISHFRAVRRLPGRRFFD